MLYSLAFILLSGIIIQLLCKKLNIPSLIGFILVGILLGPAVLNVLDPTLLREPLKTPVEHLERQIYL